jgi:L-asparagine oxygenase
VIYSFRDEVLKCGFAFASQYCPSLDAVAVAIALGLPLTPWRGGLVQDLVPRVTATPNTYSGMYGLGRFPFHTDLAHWRLPPRYLLLRCITGHAKVPTLLLDGLTIIETVTPDILTRAIFRPRRPRDGRLSLLRLCELTESGYCLRWDEVFLKPASKIGEIAGQRVMEQILKNEWVSIALRRPGDTVLIDNWRMLHSRPAIPNEFKNRRIQRVYLETLH